MPASLKKIRLRRAGGAKTKKLRLTSSLKKCATYSDSDPIKVGKQYQARLQVKGDGRGGSKKRKQHSLPGLFDTAEQAAEFRAWIKQKYPSWEVDGPPAQIEERKPRSKPAKPAQHAAMPLLPLMPMPCTSSVMAMPIPTPMLNAPFVAVSALPPSPLPRCSRLALCRRPSPRLCDLICTR